jgi:hypothetical protein
MREDKGLGGKFRSTQEKEDEDVRGKLSAAAAT